MSGALFGPWQPAVLAKTVRNVNHDDAEDSNENLLLPELSEPFWKNLFLPSNSIIKAH